MEPAPLIPATPEPPKRPSSDLRSGGHRRRRRRKRESSDRTPAPYAWCDRITGALIYFLVVFTPWAFGTTHDWAIWTANVAGYALGGLLLAKWILRRTEAFHPPRWGEAIVIEDKSGEVAAGPATTDGGTRLLAAITVLFLGYVLVGALNSRADYDDARRQFEYFGDPIRWLPVSYDRGATWFAFAQYLGLACAFWAVRDWLLHRIGADRKEDDSPRWAEPHGSITIPVRMQRLLWVLCLNGALLALTGILQRADDSNRLLWILESTSDKSAESVFGPWSYRSNAAQYFNLIWPVCLAFWLWTQERAVRSMRRQGGKFDGPQLLLLPCAIFMAACPMISTSRGGALLSIAVGGLSVVALVWASRRDISPVVRWLTIGALVFAGLVAVIGGWNSVRNRVLRTDSSFGTRIDTVGNDFSLLMRLQVPPQPPKTWNGLISLSRDARSAWQPNGFLVNIGTSGHLYAQMSGAVITNVARRVATNFVQTFADREVLLAVVRGDSLRIYADGVEVPAIDSRSKLAPEWNAPVLTRFIFSLSPAVSEAALVNYALGPEEIAAAGRGSLTLLTNLVAAGPAMTEDAVEDAKELDLVDGAEAELVVRPSDPNSRWLSLRRTGAPGALAVRRTLSSLDERLRGPLRVAFSAWNPASDPIHLAVSFDGGTPGIVEVPARGDANVTVACRAPHGRSPQFLDLVLSDEFGEAVTDAPGDARFMIRGLRVSPDPAVFAQSFDQRLNLSDLSDRMSGRPEIYRNARKMKADFDWLGSGAGTFATLYQLYMEPGERWAAYAHDDWLETSITLGRLGLGLVVAALAVLFLRSWLGRGLPIMRVFLVLWWLALASCLAHAAFDFPFQVYSVLFLFVLLSSFLMVLTGVRRR